MGMNLKTGTPLTNVLAGMTEAKRTMTIGRMAMIRMQEKKTKTGSSGGVREEIAKEIGCGERAIDRCIAFAKGLDAVGTVNLDVRAKILSGELNPSKERVIAVGRVSKCCRFDMVNALTDGHLEVIRKGRNKQKEHRKEKRSDRQKLREVIETLSDDTVMEYTVESMTDQLKMMSEAFIRSVKNLLKDHPDICEVYGDLVAIELVKSVNEEINKIKESLDDGTQL